MTLSSSTYDTRARAPLRSASTRLSLSKSDSSNAATSEESSIGGTSRKWNRLDRGRQSSSLKRGPEFQPIKLTAYETGKRNRYYSLDRRSQASVSSSSDGSSSEESDTSDEEKPARPAAQQGNSQTTLYLIFGIFAVILLGSAIYLYRSQSTSSSSSDVPSSSATTQKSLAGTAQTSSTISATSSLSKTLSDDHLSDFSAAATSTAGLDDSTLKSSASPTATSTSKESDKTASSESNNNNGAPPEYSGVTLSGTFVDTASYAVATGKAATVSDDKANADMSKIQVEPNKNIVENKEGKIWVGDVTFYAAGKGGYGSCGTKLYDGQDLYFAAMSVYDLMGSASPSPFCYSCISLQSTKDPSNTITAIVSDSCPACTLGHVDLEQRAFFALDATVDMGVLTVAWSFVDCPDGWSKDALEKTSESVYEEVES